MENYKSRDFNEIEITVEAQKILCCIERTGERYGKQVISDVLRGIMSDRTERLSGQSTFGIMWESSEDYIFAIIGFLSKFGYIVQQGRALNWSKKSYAVVHGMERIFMLVPKHVDAARIQFIEKDTGKKFNPIVLAEIKTIVNKQIANKLKNEREPIMKKVYNFLKDAGTYYIATVDGDQPRVRPFGTVNIFEDKLYIQTGKGKAVNDQIIANGKVELCATCGDEWIRVSGTLVLDERVEAGEAMLDAYPNLRNMYTTGENGNSVVYYFKDATAVISAFSHAPKIIKF